MVKTKLLKANYFFLNSEKGKFLLSYFVFVFVFTNSGKLICAEQIFDKSKLQTTVTLYAMWVLKPQDSFGIWEKIKWDNFLLLIPDFIDLYELWMPCSLFAPNLFNFQEITQNIKMFGVPPNTLP